MFNDNNPYAPPCDNSKGKYDWTLAKRVFRVCIAMVTLLAAFDVGMYMHYRSIAKKTTGQYDSRAPANWMTDFLFSDIEKAIRDII